MADTTDIEKKSLEAHVELCAERYEKLENKLENVETTNLELKTAQYKQNAILNFPFDHRKFSQPKTHAFKYFEIF